MRKKFDRILENILYPIGNFREYIQRKSSPVLYQACHKCHEEALKKDGWERKQVNFLYNWENLSFTHQCY